MVDDVEDIIGGSGNDILRGNDAANRLDGRGGNDQIFGLGGIDHLYGGAGDDRLFARDNAVDFLDGGPGFDRASKDTGDLTTKVEGVIV